MPSQRSRRSNTFACSSLPTDVLLEIFSNTVDPDEFASTVWSDEDLAVPRVLLQVCSSWRRTAFSCHSLWLAIPLHDNRWTELALRLSQPKLINVEMPAIFTAKSSPKYLSTPATLLVWESLSRAKNLRIIGGASDLSAVIIPKHVTTPSLQKLEVKNFWSTLDGAKKFWETFESLPQLMRAMLISQCSDMRIQMLSNAMTSLTLNICSIFVPPAAVLDVLAASPSLQQLDMRLICIWPLDAPPVERRSVSLPNLSSLALAGCSAHICAVLPYLAIPSEAKLEVYILESNRTRAVAPSADASLEPVLRALSEHFSHAPEGYALSRSIQFKCSYDPKKMMHFALSAPLPQDTYTMEVAPVRERDVWLGDASSANYQFSLGFTYTDSQLCEWADKMVANTQYLHEARMLSITSTRSFGGTDQLVLMGSDWWARNLQPFSQVETLCVVFPTLVDALSSAFSEWDEHKHRRILPKLRTIHLNFGSFGAPSPPDAETSSWTLFLKAIQKRMAGGSLQRIELNCCIGVGKERLAQLQELVEVSEHTYVSPKLVDEMLAARI